MNFSIIQKVFVAGIVFAAVVFIVAQTVEAKDERVTISAFVRADCIHCAKEKEFLNTLKKENPALDVFYYDLNEEKNKILFEQIAEQYGLVKGTPITLVRGMLVQGFESDYTTGKEFRALISKKGDNKRFEDIREGGAIVFGGAGATCNADEVCLDKSFFVRIPVIGARIDVGSMPLFALSAILGFIDGFNPCAMWALVMFLIILSQVGSRKRMLQYAGLFILAEAVMYYLILTVWMTAWDFIALNRITLPAVGALAVASGMYFIYRFIAFKPVCSVTNTAQQTKISARIRLLSAKPLTLGVAIGILGLAFSVNVFEFACSVGIPQTFTKIIELNTPYWLVQQAYMLTYVFMYMVDDLIVFGIALYSISKISSTYAYVRWSTLAGGIFMLILGTLLLFRPQALIF